MVGIARQIHDLVIGHLGIGVLVFHPTGDRTPAVPRSQARRLSSPPLMNGRRPVRTPSLPALARAPHERAPPPRALRPKSKSTPLHSAPRRPPRPDNKGTPDPGHE